MAELLFIEGISGVGKSTMAKMLEDGLMNHGHAVKTYLESDFTNPLDFYCTAYFTSDKYEKLLEKYKPSAGKIKSNTISAGDARLIRYCNSDIPLFEGALLEELSGKEFCYRPASAVPLKEYTKVYKEVWSGYADRLDEAFDFYIFDGSLIHHPVNDMMRNYNITGEQAVSHVKALLNSLGLIKYHIFYLKTDNISGQLKKAHFNRGQSVPTQEQIEFWESRYEIDLDVLNSIWGDCRVYDISCIDYDMIKKDIICGLQ